MPVTRITSDYRDILNNVEETIIAELKHPNPEGSDPLITIFEIPDGNVHYRVVSNGFRGIRIEDRPFLILRAIGQAVGESEVERVSRAIGLTFEEAERTKSKAA